MRYLAVFGIFTVCAQILQGCAFETQASGPIGMPDAGLPFTRDGGAVDDANDSALKTLVQSCTFSGNPSTVGVATALTEASGLAASRIHADTLYAHNDSGDTARVFMLDTKGQLRNTVSVEGAAAVDWEDIAVGKCPSGHCVFVGDIGDNNLERTSYQIYRFAEPTLTQTSVRAEAFRFSYPDGPHNAETLFADALGALYVVTKKDAGTVQVFALGIPGASGMAQLSPVEVATFTPPIPVDRVTGGDFFPGPRPLLAIRTYLNVLLWRGNPGDGPVAMLKQRPMRLSAPNEMQGEAIAFSAAGDAIYSIGEGNSQALHRYECAP
jgi:hypothetical protein